MNYPNTEQENIGVAVDLLLSFKVDKKLENQKKGCKDSDDAVFKCKICNKEFQSFQALGGHCTSHKRHKIRVRGLDMKIKSRGHVCSVCGKEFSTGQSLGGHMRRHRKTSIDSSSNFHLGPLDLKSSDSDVPRLLPLFL